ncbi:MAG: hypothetical protein WD690_09205 [Vicinamibacterales bacterium]
MSFQTKHVAALGVIAVLMSAPASAQSTQTTPPADKAQVPAQAQPVPGTTVEFAVPTRLPGITLQPGKYLFRIGTPMERQNVVEVFSSDGTKKIVTLLTVDYATPAPPDTTTVVFENTNPPAMRVWYIPGQPIGREFVYTQEEAAALHASANMPVLWATWNPDDRTVIGRVDVQTVGQAIGQTARAVADVTKDVARAVADVTEDVWDDLTDNVRLVNPTESRKAAERHLDAAERAYDNLEDRAADDVDARLLPVKTSLEALEDAFERNQPWIAHYTTVMASIDALAPDKPVGTAGGGTTLDASTTAALAGIRGHLKAFHAQAMK